MAGPEITNDIPLNIGQPTLPSNVYYNTGIQYDIAVGGQPFILSTSDQRPYERVTAPFRKQQFDNSAEPGEQSLTGWWIRSQSSFHRGAGIKYYDPSAGEEVAHRFKDSRNVNVWTAGEVTLLKRLNNGPTVTGVRHVVRSIREGAVDAVLVLDGSGIRKVYGDGTAVVLHAGTVFAMCDDGENVFYVTSNGSDLVLNRRPIVGGAATVMFTAAGVTPEAGRTVLEFVKGRMILANRNSIFELTPVSSALPTAIYIHPTVGYTFTAIAESGAAIYVAGFSGTQSSIFKFALTATGTIPTLGGGNVVAEMPSGESITAMNGYLGLLLLGTSKGVRVAQVDETGDLVYGPLVFESSYAVTDFACRDKFAWVASGVGTEMGLRRIDLSEELVNNSLSFAYANDLVVEPVEAVVIEAQTTAVAFLGTSDRIVFTAANQRVFIEDAVVLAPSGFLETGRIRYGTLEPKHFKRFDIRAALTRGSVRVNVIDSDNAEYTMLTYTPQIGTPEVSISAIQSSREFLSFRLTLLRDADNTFGPTINGYQVKALTASPRQRLIKYPVYVFDVETDRYNNQTGYRGRAYERITALEDLEGTGDEVTVQDFTTGEQFTATIEEVAYTGATPPDKRFSGFGGLLSITVRKL